MGKSSMLPKELNGAGGVKWCEKSSMVLEELNGAGKVIWFRKS